MTHTTLPKGLSLPTVLVMLALTSLAALLAWRHVWLADQWLNAEADLLRTQHKAQAALGVAHTDIAGTTSNEGATPNLRHTPGDTTLTHAFFPNTLSEYDLLHQRLSANGAACSAGICAPDTLATSTTQASYWKSQTPTAMPVAATDSPYGTNTAWYWVDVLPHVDTTSFGFVYRITVLALGVMPGSSVVLQAIWTRQNTTDFTGQWRSWHILHD